MNASCEFDVDTLRPTYRLLLGIPGKSNAFAISQRLGLPEEIIRDARERVGVSGARLEETIEKLEQTRSILDRDRLGELIEARDGYCDACFGGSYPAGRPAVTEKYRFERKRSRRKE